ncbi:MAG TPA: DUF4383 domain-containing protein [Micromonosporaceae bacterium]|jgi:hypothetical protein|nr:DUF4383 domain-containing protein [Micromonosporaceae bacterium]
MSHIPVNHPLRTFYRFLAALAGIYVLILGIVAFTKTSDLPAFEQHNLPWTLGLRTNLAFATISMVAGAVIIVAALIGRNVDRFINVAGGIAFMAMGALMMVLMETDANFLGFSMANCIVSFIIGVVLFTAGLYGKTGPEHLARAEELARTGH